MPGRWTRWTGRLARAREPTRRRRAARRPLPARPPRRRWPAAGRPTRMRPPLRASAPRSVRVQARPCIRTTVWTRRQGSPALMHRRCCRPTVRSPTRRSRRRLPSCRGRARACRREGRPTAALRVQAGPRPARRRTLPRPAVRYGRPACLPVRGPSRQRPTRPGPRPEVGRAHRRPGPAPRRRAGRTPGRTRDRPAPHTAGRARRRSIFRGPRRQGRAILRRRQAWAPRIRPPACQARQAQARARPGCRWRTGRTGPRRPHRRPAMRRRTRRRQGSWHCAAQPGAASGCACSLAKTP